MKTILYVDDNQAKINEFKNNLKDFNIISIDNSLRASDEIHKIEYDILVLDIIMPFVDGFALYDKAVNCENYVGQPIFFISETNDEEQMLLALKKGVSELLTPDMPWPVKRQRILNKIVLPEKEQSLFSDLSLDFPRSIVRKNGLKVALTNKEMLMLDIVLKNENVEADSLLEKVWEGSRAMAKNNIATHMSNLNKKIKSFGIRMVSRKGVLSLIKTD